MIKFSVIIPTYNRASDLDRCLASLVTQTFTDFEVIICDDGSTDNTKSVVDSYCNRLDVKYIWQENWGGPARPRNSGIKLAQADWICFLDSDDWWYPNKLEKCFKYLDSADIIYHDLDVYDKTLRGPLKRLRSRQLSDDPFTDLMLDNNALFNSSVVVKKSILNQVGGLTEDKKLISVEDLDCWLKISKITRKFLYLPESLGAYYIEANISRGIKHSDSLEALGHKYISDLHSDKVRARVTRILRYNQARICHINHHYGRAGRLYWRAGLRVLAEKMFRYFSTKIINNGKKY